MDLHALTLPKNCPPDKLRHDVLVGVATMLACGLDNSPNCSLFVQSTVPQHCELAWILGCISPLGLLQRQVQFKDKSMAAAAGGTTSNETLGLLSYPVLMAADVLLYRATIVPVGEDQVQHLELARDLAQNFKRMWNYSFPLPQCKLGPSHRVMSLTDATKKMSKSSPEEHSRILVTDSADIIRRKIQRAKTDSLGAITLDDASRVELRNMIDIYVAVTGTSPQVLQGKLMGEFKTLLVDALVAELCPVGQRIEALLKDPLYLHSVLEEGRRVASARAEETMIVIRKHVGLR